MTDQQQFLIDAIVEGMAARLVEEGKMPVVEALATIYGSTLYDKITDLETGLYCQSAGYNYNLLERELAYGKPR